MYKKEGFTKIPVKVFLRIKLKDNTTIQQIVFFFFSYSTHGATSQSIYSSHTDRGHHFPEVLPGSMPGHLPQWLLARHSLKQKELQVQFQTLSKGSCLKPVWEPTALTVIYDSVSSVENKKFQHLRAPTSINVERFYNPESIFEAICWTTVCRKLF